VLEPVGDGEHLVAPLGEHHVLTLDVATAEMAAIDIGAPVATFGVAVHEPSGLLLVLTNDGAVHLVDPDAGAVLAQAEVLEPTVEGEPDQPYRMLAVSDDDVFVSDPDSQAVAELTVGDGTLTAEATHDLGFAPAYLGVLNG
jgi:hypothetical protein